MVYAPTIVEMGIPTTLRIGPTGLYTRSQNQLLSAVWVRLAKAYADIKECAVAKGMLLDTDFLLLARATCSAQLIS